MLVCDVLWAAWDTGSLGVAVWERSGGRSYRYSVQECLRGKHSWRSAGEDR